MKNRIFYGWYIVIAGLVITTLNGMVFAYGWTAFVNPIVATFGWTMLQLSLATSLRGIETGVFNPIFGVIIDRWSARGMALLGVLTSALAALILAFMQNLAMYYIGFLIVGIGMSLTGGVVATTTVARWFKKDIGKANGLLFMGPAIGGMLVPLIVFAIDKITWQHTLLIMTGLYLIIGIPMALLFRSWPADMGLQPDGKSAAGSGPQTNAVAEHSFTVKESMRTRAFWHLALITIFQFTTQGTVTLYALPYLESVGMERAIGAGMISMYTTVSMLSRLPLGTVSDYMRKTRVLTLTVFLMLAGMIVLWMIDAKSPLWLMLIFAVTYGIGSGGVMVLRAPILTEYYGRKNLGAIFGINSAFITAATVIATPIAGWVWDTQHSYKVFWFGVVLLGVLAAVAALTMPRPRAQAEAKATAVPSATVR